MAEHVHADALHVLRRDVAPAFQESVGFGRKGQRDGGARGGAELNEALKLDFVAARIPRVVALHVAEEQDPVHVHALPGQVADREEGVRRHAHIRLLEPARVRKDARALDRVDDLEALREDRRDRLVANLFRDRLKNVRDLGPLHLRARADRGLHRSAVVRADERRSFEFRDVLDADLQRGLQRFEDRRRLRARKVLELSIGAEEPVRELLAVAHGLAIREVFQDRLEVHPLVKEVSKVPELRHVPHLRQDVFPVLLRAAVDGDVCLPRLRDREFALPQKAVDLASLRRLRLWMDDFEDVFQLHLTVAVILRQLVRIEVLERLGESSLQRVAQHALLGLVADVAEGRFQ